MSYVDLAGGFPLVSQHLLESKVVVESLVVFWKEFTTIEETYAKSLRELLGSPAASFRSSILQRFAGFFNSESGFEEGKSVKNGWSQVTDEIAGIAGFHASLATNLKKEVISKLESYLSESEPRKKQVVNRGKTSLADINKVQTNLEKERARYQRLTKEVESLMKAMSDTTLSAARNSKVKARYGQWLIQSQIAGLKKEVETCISKYKSYVEEYRGLHQQYYTKQQPLIMREMQNMEVERIELIKLSIGQFNELFVAVVPFLKKGYLKVKAESESISHELDITDFVESHSEYTQIPSLPSAEPSGDPEPPKKPKEDGEEDTKENERQRKVSDADESEPLPNGTTAHKKVISSLPDEGSALKPPAPKQIPEEPIDTHEESAHHPTPFHDKNAKTNDYSHKFHDKNKRNSTKIPEHAIPETIDDVPLEETTTRRRRAHTQPPAPSHDKNEDWPENAPHSPTTRPTKTSQPTIPTRTSTEYHTLPLEPLTAHTNSSSNHQTTEPFTQNTQNDEDPFTKTPELSVSVPSTTNKFSAGAFRSSNAISSRIDRFNQSSYSSTAFKKDDFSYSSKPTKENVARREIVPLSGARMQNGAHEPEIRKSEELRKPEETRKEEVRKIEEIRKEEARKEEMRKIEKEDARYRAKEEARLREKEEKEKEETKKREKEDTRFRAKEEARQREKEEQEKEETRQREREDARFRVKEEARQKEKEEREKEEARQREKEDTRSKVKEETRQREKEEREREETRRRDKDGARQQEREEARQREEEQREKEELRKKEKEEARLREKEQREKEEAQQKEREEAKHREKAEARQREKEQAQQKEKEQREKEEARLRSKEEARQREKEQREKEEALQKSKEAARQREKEEARQREKEQKWLKEKERREKEEAAQREREEARQREKEQREKEEARQKEKEVTRQREKEEARRREKEQREREEERQKEKENEGRNYRAKARGLPEVPTRQREWFPEARQTERKTEPVPTHPNTERPKSPPRARSDDVEMTKPAVPTTPTRTSLTLTRTKSTPNLPVVQEPPESEEKTEAEEMLEALENTARANDIYLLFGIDAATPMDEIGKRRRQLTQQLHPDNFVKGSEEWNEAQQRMARVNQAYNNVLRKDIARALYDKIAMYRQSYAKLLRKSDGVLQTAANNLYALRESLRTTNMPHFLVDELDQSLGMLKVCRGIRPQL